MNQENVHGQDVSCNLSSIDIHNSTKYHNFAELIDTSMRLLTNVSNMTNIVNVPSVSKGNKEMHSVGLGVMNANGHFLQHGLEYGSKESIDFIDTYMEALNYYSIVSSMSIAKERGETFLGFEKSEYANGKYFDKYINGTKTITPKTIEMLGNVPLITVEMWGELKEQVMKYGLYHSYRLAVAP